MAATGVLETLAQVLPAQLANGLVLGSVYALVALGYTMVYGILGLINFAHGDVLMVGGLLGFSILKFFQSHYPELHWALMLTFSILLTMPCCMLLNVLIERVAYRPLRNAPKLTPLITAIGVSLLLQTLAMMIWGRDQISVGIATQQAQSYTMFGDLVRVSQIDLAIVVVAFVTMVGLLFLVNKTRLGRAMRATSENTKNASLMGVNPNATIAATFAIGAALAVLAGVLWVTKVDAAKYDTGFILGLKAFSAAVLGGIGNLAGAVVGGLLLGILENAGIGILSELTHGKVGSNYADVFAFLCLVLCLTLRPSGLLGERTADRA
jgi:branched-chain amino acid transport system permease protein